MIFPLFSAGVGRTGTFIGIFAMLDMIEATQTVDIYNFVCQMRTQRTHMVQVEVSHCFLMSLSKNIIIYSNLFIEVYEKSFQLVR